MRPAVRAAHLRLLDTRDALHLTVGRRVDRLVAQERSAVADLLGLDDGDALLRRVAGDARTVAHALDDAWRAADRLRTSRRRGAPAGPPVRRPVARDVVEQDGELVLARTAIGPVPDPSLSLRVAAAAATVQLPIARATCEWLAAFCPPLPSPWPPAARAALVSLLGAGAGLLPTWETCDRYGLIDAWLPEWARHAQPAAAPPGAPIHAGPAPGAGRVRGHRVRPRGGPARPAADRRVPARRRQGTARRPQPGRGADRRRHRQPDRARRPPRSPPWPSWSGCTCCCRTLPPGATWPTR